MNSSWHLWKMQLLNGVHSTPGQFIQNKELNDLRIIICLRNSVVTVERISVCTVKKQLGHLD